jgi:hypothetical protein
MLTRPGPSTILVRPSRGRAHMSPLSVGLTEVEQRLRSLRRRLNGFTLLHAVFLAGSSVALAGALLIAVALRGSPADFRAAAAGCTVMLVMVGLGLFVHTRRRLVDAHAVARIADRRADLTDRLTTLVDLGKRLRQSPLAPLLVKQILGLAAQWSPARIQPRSVPRSVFVLLASLAVLAAVPFVSRHLPPPAVSAATPQPPEPPGTAAEPEPRPGQKAAAAQPLMAGETTLPASELDWNDGMEEAGESNAEGSLEASQELAGLAALPQQLQDRIRQAFGAEPLGPPRQLARRGGVEELGAREDSEPGTSDARAREGHEGLPGDREGESGGEIGKIDPDSRQARPDGAPSRDTNEEQQMQGSASGAGGGSSPGGLMGGEASELGTEPGGATTFKVTITSFLRGIEQKGRQPQGKQPRLSGSRAPATKGDPVISDYQRGDDLLRKAEIPPEYEDVVRRVYSTRASQ